MKAKPKLTIGITIAPADDADALLWSNGLSQNILYLGLLLRRLPEVAEVGFIADAQPHALADRFGFPAWNVADAADRCDIVIELGSRSFGQAQVDKLRKRGGKLVSYVAGNVMAFNFEAIAHGKANGEQLVAHGFDAVWLLPQHWHMCRSYCAITSSPNVQQIPAIWDPVVLNQMAALLRRNPFWREPEDRRYALGCFDPNVNVLKTFHLPLLVTEEAYRLDKKRIERLFLFSALRFTKSRHVTEMITATDLGRDGKVSLEGRHSPAYVLGEQIHGVVTHQWENNLNYLYFEILYLGWPLVHNSPHLHGAGYRYADFDCQDGGRKLHEALEGHSATRIRQRDAVREALWSVCLDNPAVQDRYSELLAQVMDWKG